MWSGKQLGEAALPLGFVDHFEAHRAAAHGRDEVGPVAAGRMLGADVEYRALVVGVGGLLEVEALGLYHEHLLERVGGVGVVGLQGEDEVGVDLAPLPALHVVVLPGAVAVPEEQALLLIEEGRDAVLQGVQFGFVRAVEQIEQVLAAILAVGLAARSGLDLPGQSSKAQVFGRHDEAHLAGLEEAGEHTARQAIALDLQPFVQLFQDEAVVAHHQRTSVPLQESAEQTPCDLAAAPRIRHDIQQMAGGERMVQAPTAAGTVASGIRRSRCNAAVHADLHLDVVARSFAERKFVEGCDVHLVPRRA